MPRLSLVPVEYVKIVMTFLKYNLQSLFLSSTEYRRRLNEMVDRSEKEDSMRQDTTKSSA